MVTGLIQSLLSFARDFEETYDIRFVDAGISHILDSLMSLKFLPISLPNIHTRYTTDGKMFIKQNDVLFCYFSWPKRAQLQVLCQSRTKATNTSKYQDGFVLIRASDSFDNTNQKPPSFKVMSSTGTRSCCCTKFVLATWNKVTKRVSTFLSIIEIVTS